MKHETVEHLPPVCVRCAQLAETPVDLLFYFDLDLECEERG